MAKKAKPETYKIVRFFKTSRCNKRVMQRGLTRKEAEEWMKDLNSSSETAWKTTPLKTTRRCGDWFDGFAREE